MIHCAAYTNVDGCEKEPDKAFNVNAEGARNVAKAYGALKPKCSTSARTMCTTVKKQSLTSRRAGCGPLNVYGQSKLKGEQEVLKVLPDALVVRTSWLFGKNGPNFVEAILSQVGKKDELSVDFGPGSGTRHIRGDLADALTRLVEADASGIFHAANNGHCSWFEYAKEILRLHGAEGIKVKPVTTADLEGRRSARHIRLFRKRNTRMSPDTAPGIGKRP